MKFFVVLLIFSFSAISLAFFRQCGRSLTCTSGLTCCTCDSHVCMKDDDCDQIFGLTCVSRKCKAEPNKQLLLRKSLPNDNTTILSDFCNNDRDCFDESHCRDNKCTHNLVRKRETCTSKKPMKPMDCICVCANFPSLFKQCKKMLPKCIHDEDCASHSFCLDDKKEDGQSRCTPLIPRQTKPK